VVIAPDVSAASLTTALCGACGGGAGGGAGSHPLSVVATLLDIADCAPTTCLSFSGSLSDGAPFGAAFGAAEGDAKSGDAKSGDAAPGLIRLELFAPPGDAAALACTMRALGIGAPNVARLLLFGEECAATLLAHDPQRPGACAAWRLAAAALLFEGDVEGDVEGGGEGDGEADDAGGERARAASFDALAEALQMEVDRSSPSLCTMETAAALRARLKALLVSLGHVKEEGLRSDGGYYWRDASDVLAAQPALRAAAGGGRGGGRAPAPPPHLPPSPRKM
jgi:hypothetical protein